VVYRHALRNAMIPVITVLGLQFGALLAGAVLVWLCHQAKAVPGAVAH